MKAVALVLLLSGCAATSRWRCESIWCEPPPCQVEDKYLVGECIEKDIEHKRSVAGWFGGVILGIGQLAARVF